jgi:hypothetical protein
MLRCCCPCLGRKAVERFEQAKDKTFNKSVKAADEDKGLLATDGFELDDDIEDHVDDEGAGASRASGPAPRARARAARAHARRARTR